MSGTVPPQKRYVFDRNLKNKLHEKKPPAYIWQTRGKKESEDELYRLKQSRDEKNVIHKKKDCILGDG